MYFRWATFWRLVQTELSQGCTIQHPGQKTTTIRRAREKSPAFGDFPCFCNKSKNLRRIFRKRGNDKWTAKPCVDNGICEMGIYSPPHVSAGFLTPPKRATESIFQLTLILGHSDVLLRASQWCSGGSSSAETGSHQMLPFYLLHTLFPRPPKSGTAMLLSSR